MAADHACIDEGDEAANVVKNSSYRVGPALRGRGQPRGRGQGRLMCARVLASASFFIFFFWIL